MELCIGVVLGVAAGWLLCLLPDKKTANKPHMPVSREQRQLWHEYQNFLTYTGEEQEEFEE